MQPDFKYSHSWITVWQVNNINAQFPSPQFEPNIELVLFDEIVHCDQGARSFKCYVTLFCTFVTLFLTQPGFKTGNALERKCFIKPQSCLYSLIVAANLFAW